MYDKKTSREWQGMVIGITVFSVIILPNIREIIPNSAINVFEQYLTMLGTYKSEVIYGVFLLYTGFLCSELIVFMAKALIPDLLPGEKVSLKKRAKRWAVLSLFFLGPVPGLIVTTLYIAGVFIRAGRLIVGDDFVILLGFFVFPIWMATLLAFVGAVFLLVVPLKVNAPEQSHS